MLKPRTNNFAQTYNGNRWHYEDPKAEDISLDDIAHGLAQIVRFNGQMSIDESWKVGQHSLTGLYMAQALGLSQQEQKEVLMHDAPETWFGDMIRPLRKLNPVYDQLYTNSEIVVFKHYGLRYPLPPVVCEIDDRLMLTEASILHNVDISEELHWWSNKQRYSNVSYLDDDATASAYEEAFERVRWLRNFSVKALFIKEANALGIY